MATPQVAGIAGVIKAANPKYETLTSNSTY